MPIWIGPPKLSVTVTPGYREVPSEMVMRVEQTGTATIVIEGDTELVQRVYDVLRPEFDRISEEIEEERRSSGYSSGRGSRRSDP